MVSVMRIGIGLPAAVPGATASALGDWAEASDRAGFASVSVLDRLVYDNLDPLVALAVAAARTERVELLATVLNVPYRVNPVLLAKQLASIDQVSDGRLTAGLALGGWPEDAEASGIELRGRGPVLDAMLATMRQVWDGGMSGAAGPMPALPEGRPGLLFGGLTPASFRRVASSGLGWVAPFFGLELLVGGIEGTRRAWSEAERGGQPRIVAERYFCLGSDADRTADDYLAHYYGPDYFAAARTDSVTSREEIRRELERLDEAGCDDVILFPCSHALGQVELLATALDDLGIPTTPETSE
jgi:alkanesulfonate monooxygenase SsuD/methylene tetrahydromethanopterin reductase-like flavin-dependent oxidoreductase (luciferase family)